jgi:phosphoribosylanthranilate isomerase
MRIKICGITNVEDALDAVSLGADAIGFIFTKDSKRYISPEQAESIALFLPPFVSIVGVFVNASKEEIDDTVTRCKLDLIQLHGHETPAFCQQMSRRVIKAFHMAEPEDVDPIGAYQGIISAALLDTKVQNLSGGTGKVFDWGLALQVNRFEIPLILAGGISVQNIKKARQLVNPYAVDLSSSVEASPGKKDYNKMKDFVEAVRSL